jgi:hypothetical protein
MKLQPTSRNPESGKIGWMALLWIVGIPLPIVLIIGLLSSCN